MKRRNLRKKTQSSEDDTPVEGAPSTAARASTGVLSFDVEEGDAHLKAKGRRKGGCGATVSLVEPRRGGEYTAEKLDQLKRQTMGATPVRTTPSVSNEPTIKVTGTFKPASAPSPSPAFIPVNPPNVASKEVGKEEEGAGDHFVPPDTEMIEMAKAKRERLRQAQLAPDYVPLGGASNLLSQDFKQSERRASSESDAEEDHMRLQFIGTRSAKIKTVDEEVGLDVMEDEDAVDSFVDTQIKKGIAATGASEKSKTPKPPSHAQGGEEELIELPNVTRASIAAGARRAYEHFEKERGALLAAQDETNENLGHTRHRLREALEGIETIQEQSRSAEQRFADVQEMREYVADLCACLKEKLAFVEAMEDHVKEIYDQIRARIEKSDAIHKEDLELADVASNAVLETLGAGGTLEVAAQNAEDAVARLETNLASSETSAQDPTERRRRWAEALESLSEQETGVDDQSIREQLQEVASAAAELFSDALPEFGSIPAITCRLSAFKKQHPKLYETAYIADSLPALLAPFARLDVLSWSPLHGASPLGLEHQSWYRHLESFGDEAEEQLVPELVKRVVLPSAGKQIGDCWTPFSKEQSECVAEMLRELLVYVAVEDSEMQALLLLVQRKLKEAADACGVPPYTRPAMTASMVVQSVVQIRFRRAVELVETLACFVDVLPATWVSALMMRDVVCEQLLPFLRGSLHQLLPALRRIVALFERVPHDFLKSQVCPGEWMQISEVINVAARALEKQWTEVRSTVEREGLIPAFIEVLSRLGKDDLVAQLKERLL